MDILPIIVAKSPSYPPNIMHTTPKVSDHPRRSKKKSTLMSSFQTPAGLLGTDHSTCVRRKLVYTFRMCDCSLHGTLALGRTRACTHIDVLRVCVPDSMIYGVHPLYQSGQITPFPFPTHTTPTHDMHV